MTEQYCIYSFLLVIDFFGFCFAGDFNARLAQKFWMTKAFSLKISVGLAFHLNSRYGFEIP